MLTSPVIGDASSFHSAKGSKMKTHKIFSTLLIVAFALAPLLNTSRGVFAASGGYSATLISPTVGQVVYPSQHVTIQWRDTLPSVRYFTGCEMEVWLSLDGGRTFQMWITPILDPKTTHFDWIVPNTPTNAAVLDIRFGCDGWYPESFAPQPASTFVIAHSAGSPTALH
jgi:hypothetical protein